MPQPSNLSYIAMEKISSHALNFSYITVENIPFKKYMFAMSLDLMPEELNLPYITLGKIQCSNTKSLQH